MNRANLEKLAAYLEGLPADYKHFGMRYYFKFEGRSFSGPSDVPVAGSCGTVACAVGHGPAAGIPSVSKFTSWTLYAYDVFKVSELEFDWCFSGVWSDVDNTHHGAAKRIRYMLEHGVPKDGSAQVFGDAPYLFAEEAA